jgi:hypothetical protein
MSERARLLQRMERARRALNAATDPLLTRLDDVIDPGDGTLVRDLLAHIGGWQRVVERRIAVRSAGGANGPIDVDDYNRALRELGRQWSDDEVRWEFDAAYRALRAVVASAPEELCLEGGYVRRQAETVAVHHYVEHLELGAAP